MKTIKKICDSIGIHCTEHELEGQEFFLIDGKVVFEKDFLVHPFARDIMHRAYLNYCGMDIDKYYRTVYNTLEKELR